MQHMRWMLCRRHLIRPLFKVASAWREMERYEQYASHYAMHGIWGTSFIVSMSGAGMVI